MKVIIADDHPVVRQGLRQMLAVESDLTVVGEARNGQEVVDLSRRVPWEVAVLDYNMPGKNGLELIKELRQRYPGRAVLILSMYPEDRYAVRALKAGASGYLVKDSAPLELRMAIDAIMRGEHYVSSRVSGHLVAGLADGHKGATSTLDGLTPRQREILQMVAEGKSTKEIAFSLEVSVKTVETHRTALMDRLAIHDVAGLVVFAIKSGLIDIGRAGA